MSIDDKRYISLRWTLLEAKYFYYHKPESKHVRPDSWYDTLEDELLILADKLGKPGKMAVGFPIDTGSGRMVAEKCEMDDFKYTIY